MRPRNRRPRFARIGSASRPKPEAVASRAFRARLTHHLRCRCVRSQCRYEMRYPRQNRLCISRSASVAFGQKSETSRRFRDRSSARSRARRRYTQTSCQPVAVCCRSDDVRPASTARDIHGRGAGDAFQSNCEDMNLPPRCRANGIWRPPDVAGPFPAQSQLGGESDGANDFGSRSRPTRSGKPSPITSAMTIGISVSFDSDFNHRKR